MLSPAPQAARAPPTRTDSSTAILTARTQPGMPRTTPNSAKRARPATARTPRRLPGAQTAAAAAWDARGQPPKRSHVPIAPAGESLRSAGPAGRATSTLASVTAAGTPVTVVCHIRPLSAREAADAAPSVLAVRQGSFPRQGKPAEALVQSGNAAYAFNHGAWPLCWRDCFY